MIAGFDLATPLALLLLPLPWLIALARRRSSDRSGGLRIPAVLRDRLAADPGHAAPVSRARAWRWLAWIGLVVALADPRTVAATPALEASGRDIMLALDLSGSMIARDMVLDGNQVTRIDALKVICSRFVTRRAGDRIGVVVFAEHALAAVPLSFDVEGVARSVRDMTIGLVGRSTAMGVGLGLAVKRLAASTAPSRVIVLVSDGANNAGTQDPAGVAALARSLGMRVYTIGLGPNDAAAGSDDPESVDFEALQTYARIGGGEAFRARTGEDLDAAVRSIEALVAGRTAPPPAVIHRDLWVYPAGFVMLMAAGMVAAGRSRR